MTATLIQSGSTPDAELVAESRRGNREAFGRIVRRYQSMVAGVIYSHCGDFHRSEDLAQETFISAWKSLSGITDPQKLSPWLCQIARRKALDSLRAGSREKNRLTHLFHVPPAPAPAPATPPQELLAHEERKLLWHILSELPQPYRETMVLYYRQEKSAAAVALAMETTEESVRQRLARGRQMLREQVAQTLERNLVDSAPSPAFALAVLAALPALMPQAAKAATLGVAAKGSAALGAGGVISWASALISPLLGLSSGVLALRNALRSSQSPRERRCVLFYGTLLGLCIAAPFFTFELLPKILPAHAQFRVNRFVWMIAYTIVTCAIILLARRQRNSIRISEGRPTRFSAPDRRVTLPWWLVIGIPLASLAWMFDFAAKAGDTLGLIVLSVLAVAQSLIAAYCLRDASVVVVRRFTFLGVPVMAAVTMIMMKWRWLNWVAIVDHQRHPHPISAQTLLLMATVFACIEIIILVAIGRRNVGHQISQESSI